MVVVSGHDWRRLIPATDVLLRAPRLQEAVAVHGRAAVKREIHEVQRIIRETRISLEELIPMIERGLRGRSQQEMRPVINATGVIVHTNLGRAPLSKSAVAAVIQASGNTDVEFDLANGQRASRGRQTLSTLRSLVDEKTDVHIVNNNAAALLLCATALAFGKEIVISRGELVEIGDGFRLPELLESTGASIREVGTTNRTSLEDYSQAVGPQTGFILKVHPSNYRVEGFTSQVQTRELTSLGPLVVSDVGSGLLAPHPLLQDEPDVTSELRGGANIVTASGDKLLGGPQSGLIFGDPSVVQRLRKHPSARALRLDKLTLAALNATLRNDDVPVADALNAPIESLESRAQAILSQIKNKDLDAKICSCYSVVGGGGAPGVQLPSVGISLAPGIALPLRTGSSESLPVVGAMAKGRYVLDLRTVSPELDQALVDSIQAASQ